MEYARIFLRIDNPIRENEMIYFDIGANDGSSILPRIQDSDIVYAFEPTPQMADIIREKTRHLNNYHLYQVAVSDFDGTAEFNISGYEDWGCSSLLQYSENLEKDWGARHFTVTEKIQVDVIRLDSFLDKNPIEVIDFFHCDTQGSDLRVLRGMGNHISKIKMGVVEAARKPNVLYKDQNSETDTIEFLVNNGFTITNIGANDGGVNEVNIMFEKRV
jgi:FkbM family methyltransferase